MLGTLLWKEVDCIGANASLCVRLTGSFSVPHVFFNTEYIGDCSSTCAACEESDDEKNVILKKLKAIAMRPKMVTPFPPVTDAVMIKVTDDIACSSQPSQEQLVKLPKSFGLSAVINLSSPLESSYFKQEGEMLTSSEKVDFQYVHAPLVEISSSSIQRVMEEVKNAKKPVLLHCDTGQRALLIALLIATEHEKNFTEETLIALGEELGVNLKPFAQSANVARSQILANDDKLPLKSEQVVKESEEAKSMTTTTSSTSTTSTSTCCCPLQLICFDQSKSRNKCRPIDSAASSKRAKSSE